MRLVLREDFNNDIEKLIRHFRMLRSIDRIGDDWVANSLKFVMIGVKEPFTFLKDCIDKLKIIEMSRNSELRSFKILRAHGKLPNQETLDQLDEMKYKEKEPVMRRRKSKVFDLKEIEKLK